MNIYEHIMLAALCVGFIGFLVAFLCLLALWVKGVADELRGDSYE